MVTMIYLELEKIPWN